MDIQFSKSDMKRVELLLDPVVSGTADEKVLLVSCIDARYPQRLIDTMDCEFKLRGQ